MSRIVEEVGFVHLRVHSAYSLLEGALPLKRLIELASGDRMPALGIADTGNLFGALEFAEKMVEKGIQPIVGCQVAVDFADLAEESRAGASVRRPLSDLVLIAATETGYWNLVRLVSDSYVLSEADARAACRLRCARRARRGPDRAHRRPRRAGQQGACRRAGGACRGAPRPAGGGVRRPALCRAAAPRHPGRAGGRAGADRHGLCPRAGAGRHQRGLLPQARRLRCARRADRHCRGRGDRRGRPAAADAGALFQDPRRDGGAVRGSAGGDREHGRDRAPLLVVAAHAEAHPAALRRRRRRPGRGRPRRGAGAARGRRGGA